MHQLQTILKVLAAKKFTSPRFTSLRFTSPVQSSTRNTVGLLKYVQQRYVCVVLNYILVGCL